MMRTKTAIIVLVAILTVILGALAFLIGIMLGDQKQDEAVQTATLESEIISGTELQNMTSETTTHTTSEFTAVDTTQIKAETTTVIVTNESKKPTVTNAYLFWTNTGVGINLYLHVEGDFSAYSYKLYFSLFGKDEYTLDRTGGGIDTESLIASGLGVPDTFKAYVTFWNSDKTQSIEQWVYIDNSKSYDGVQHSEAAAPGQTPEAVPPSPLTHLFGGSVVTKNEELNLRSQPNTDSKVLAKIPKSTQLDIYSGGTDGWYWTYYNGQGGYVSAKYIRALAFYEEPRSDSYYQALSCLYYGEINTHGEKVPGYTDYCLLPNEDNNSVIRESLGNKWHVVSYKYMITPQTTYYELYDSQDGDYYGWVDSAYVDWYP
ncbi:MAG: SH3 domain-containing protein [Oscillospiraceae bacterium]|nr:SH3 domain-containing protein [Oscillospiraceae bacterium]